MTAPRRRLRVAVIAPLRHPITQPPAGGLEACVWDRVRTLHRRGHEVALCAVAGSDDLDPDVPELTLPRPRWLNPAEATDSTYPDGYLERALPALNRAMSYLHRHRERFDVVDNHNLHGVPIAWADRLGIPMLTTLHTPPLPDMLHANAELEGFSHRYAAVSRYTASAWERHGVEATVLRNAVDTDRWRFGRGGRDLVWFGRIVPEKGTHLAIAAARLTGRRLVIAGRIGDQEYFDALVAPELGDRTVYVGALRQDEMARLVAHSACALVTPVWEEPFGLVIAEALSAGTPVAALRIGGVAEVAGASPACVLADPGDIAGLADAARMLAAAPLSVRRAARRDAVTRFSLHERVAHLEGVYAELRNDEVSNGRRIGIVPGSAVTA